VDNVYALSLCTLLNDISPNKVFRAHIISVKHYDQDVTNFFFLGKMFASSSAMIFEESSFLKTASMSTLIAGLKDKSISKFVLFLKSNKALIHHYAVDSLLPQIGRRTLLPGTVFKNMHAREVFSIFDKSKFMSHDQIKRSARSIISDFCAKVFKFRPTSSIIFSVNKSCLERKSLKKLALLICHSLPISQALRSLIISRLSVVQKGQAQVKSILCNHIKWCKAWTPTPFPCRCAYAKKLLNINSPDIHISCFGNDTSSCFDKVLHFNQNNVCCPDIKSTTYDLYLNANKFIDDVFLLANNIERQKSIFCFRKRKKTFLPNSPGHFFLHFDLILKVVAGYGGVVQEKLVQLCKSLERDLHCFANAPPSALPFLK